MCKELCEQDETGEMQSCPDCGKLICFDVKNGDDIIRPAYVTASADLLCDLCGMAADRAEEREDGWIDNEDEWVDDEFDEDDVPIDEQTFEVGE